MKIAIYHPDLHFFGGGEMLSITIASHLSKKHEVTIFCSKAVNKAEISSFFGIDLKKVNLETLSSLPNLIPTIRPGYQLRRAYRLLNNYDVVFDTCTNGWFDRSFGPKTICYVHFPFFFAQKRGWKCFLNRWIAKPETSFVYDKILCNSDFTRSNIIKMTDAPVEIIYPPCAIDQFKPAKKEKWITTIGRISREKKHEVMIQAFKKMKGYTLNIVGPFREGAIYEQSYLDELKTLSKGYDVKFYLNIERSKMIDILQRSKIYWHARGYGESDPIEYESFGIVTVEAMASGCLCIVINLGAQPEIITHNVNGYLWNSPDELVSFTAKALRKPQIARQAIKDSTKFSKDNFLRRIDDSI